MSRIVGESLSCGHLIVLLVTERGVTNFIICDIAPPPPAPPLPPWTPWPPGLVPHTAGHSTPDVLPTFLNFNQTETLQEPQLGSMLCWLPWEQSDANPAGSVWFLLSFLPGLGSWRLKRADQEILHESWSRRREERGDISRNMQETCESLPAIYSFQWRHRRHYRHSPAGRAGRSGRAAVGPVSPTELSTP